VSKSSLAACVSLFIVVVGCRDSLAPAGPVKLLVSNSSCTSGTCATFEVLAFPENQPVTPAGNWSIDLGTITSERACLIIPASAQFTLVNAGTGARTVFTWTTSKAVSLGLIPVDGSRFMASPSTGNFIPARAVGWRVTLPGSSLPAPAVPCD
jgi:hypothetical protein